MKLYYIIWCAGCPKLSCSFLSMQAEDVFSNTSTLTVEEKVDTVFDITTELSEATEPANDSVLFPQDLSTTNEIVTDTVQFLRQNIEDGVTAALNKASWIRLISAGLTV